jgi:ABC-type transport system involved in multi-copper enzyme maturation permease subunit
MQVFILIFYLCSSFLKNSWKSWLISPWIFLHISIKFIVQLFDHEQNDVAISDFKNIPSTLSFIQQVVIWIDYTKNNQSCKQIVNIDLTQVSRLGV